MIPSPVLGEGGDKIVPLVYLFPGWGHRLGSRRPWRTHKYVIPTCGTEIEPARVHNSTESYGDCLLPLEVILCQRESSCVGCGGTNNFSQLYCHNFMFTITTIRIYLFIITLHLMYKFINFIAILACVQK